MNSDAEILKIIEALGDKYHDGHFTVMKFTTNWRVSFGGQPDSREDIRRMAEGSTLLEAIRKAVEPDSWI